jgi:hypothetical protein
LQISRLRVTAGYFSALPHYRTSAQARQIPLQKANVGPDAGILDANDKDEFIAAAKTRQWIGRNPSERWHNRQFRGMVKLIVLHVQNQLELSAGNCQLTKFGRAAHA